MIEKLKSIAESLLGIAIFIAFIGLIAFFIKGAVWFSVKVIPWVNTMSGIVFIITILVLLPMATIHKTQLISSVGMYIASYIFGLHLWIYSLLCVYALWGGVGVAIGLFLMGIGIVPIAGLAFIFNGLWSALGILLLSALIVYGTRFMAAYLEHKIERRREAEEPAILYPEYEKEED